MTSASAPQLADESTPLGEPDAPRVKVVVTLVEGADLEAALATVDRQVYEGIREVVVIGEPDGDLPGGVSRVPTLEEAIAVTDPAVDYLWILHSDARPRPDALAALVWELDRNEASLGGSKLLFAGTRDELESIGSATDVFGDPFTGLDDGEIDLQQYDVVREVAFVSSVSMLVRRDLAQGLGGLDELLEPGAAGLDFSQRVRLAGGRVITVPSSEVYHQARCEEEPGGWREEAGRLRAMLKAYRLITLLWVVPFEILVSVVDSLANLILFRWRVGAHHVMSWLWNIGHLPSTIGARRRFRQVRAVGDEELFRFQSRGSVRLREVGSELTDRILSVFDDDQALARGTRRIWSSPGIWGALLAAAVVLVASWSIIFAGVPNTGFSFPFEPPTVAFARFFAGWNDSGLGSADAVHPAAGFTGLISLLWFGAEGAARTMATVVFAVLAVLGMGRLAGRLGFRGPGRYLSGLVILAGPGTALVVGEGSWLALGAAALLPWAVRSVILHPDDRGKSWLTHVGWVLLWTMMLTAVSPVLGVVPIVAAVLWRFLGGSRTSLRLALATVLAAVVAIGFVYDDRGWLFDIERRIGLIVPDWWPVLLALTAIPLMLIEGRTRRLAFFGALLGFGGMIVVRLALGGPGAEEAALVLASFGSAIVVAAALDRLSIEPRRLLASIGAAAIVVVSILGLLNGRLGLPSGDVNERLAFATTLNDEGSPGRVLVISTDRHSIPGEARPGPGLWYRTLDGEGTTIDEIWLPESQPGDIQLALALDRIAGGADLRPGALLAEFSIDWVVVEGPETPLDLILDSQVDLVPTPLVTGAEVFENPSSEPLAATGDGVVWHRQGAGFEGPAAERALIRVNYSHGWAPPEPELQDWFVTVAADQGTASFSATGYLALAPYLAAGLLLIALVLIGWGRGAAMTKALFALVVAALAIAVLLIPSPAPPEAGVVAATNPPSVAVCPIEESSGRSTTIGVASEVNGNGRFTAFAAGVSAGSASFSTGTSGSAAVPIAEIAPLGTGAGLTELPGIDVAAASVLVGTESLAVETCVATPLNQTLLAGGSTVSGSHHLVQLMNPYAGDAMVDLVVQSESGLEAAPPLRGIRVPSRSSATIDLAEILPGRQSLSIAVEVASGNVMAVGRYDAGADGALWHSVAPALDWYVPVPAAGIGGELVISTGVAAEVGFQLDVYGPQGLVEGFQDGVVPSRGATVVPISGMGFEGASALRVISTQPVAVFLRSSSESGVAITSGASETSSTWLLPGAGLAPGGLGSVVILNAGLDEDTVIVTARRAQSAAKQFALPAGTVLEVPAFEGGANAYAVRGLGALVPLWVTTSGTGIAYSIGEPLIDE